MAKRSNRKSDKDSQANKAAAEPDGFLALRGILRDVFAQLSGGEAFIRAERESQKSGVETNRHCDACGSQKSLPARVARVSVTAFGLPPVVLTRYSYSDIPGNQPPKVPNAFARNHSSHHHPFLSGRRRLLPQA
jgi:hypothetical protein